MDIIKEFEKEAAECRAMARATRDPKARAVWTEMAERWARLAQSHPLARKPGAEVPRPAGPKNLRAA